jgi:hypothetical protein
MITLYGFARVYPGMAGEGRDMRVQWALVKVGSGSTNQFS